MKNFIYLLLLGLLMSSCGTQKSKYYKTIMSKEDYNQLKDGLYANLETNKGTMLVELFETEAPLTVANFVGLAEGTKENKVKPIGEPFYDGTIFHRIIQGFMIQGGDPEGTGSGGPGYAFKDEKNNQKHESKGYLSMANSGPNTNGSQFFITEVPTPWLDGKHTIFGKVIEGENIIDSIVAVPKGAGDRPKEDVVLNKVTIIRKGKEYASYEGGASFTKYELNVEERNKAYLDRMKAEKEKEQQERLTQIKTWEQDLQSTDSGLRYKILNQTDGAQPKKGDNLQVHYTGMLEDGTIFDSSYPRKQPIEFQADSGRMIKGWDEGVMLLKEGEKAVFFIPSELGYGSRGAGGVIPPNANLVFELELVKVN